MELTEPPKKTWWSSGCRKLLLAAILVPLLVGAGALYVYKSGRTDILPATGLSVRARIHFDGFQPKKERELDIVISHFSESVTELQSWLDRYMNISSIRDKHPHLWIYCKGMFVQIHPTDFAGLKYPFRLVSLFNVGREGHTYLQHIVDNYDNLAKHTLFTQAKLANIERSVFRLNTLFTPQTGMLGLAEAFHCTCDGCFTERENLLQLREFFSLASHQFCPEVFTSFMQGEFVVSSKRIYLQKKELYKYLLEVFEAHPSHFVHKTNMAGLSAPWFGHTVERAWTILFNCTDVEIAASCCNAESCPDLKPDACQCTDDATEAVMIDE